MENKQLTTLMNVGCDQDDDNKEETNLGLFPLNLWQKFKFKFTNSTTSSSTEFWFHTKMVT